ncbi:MAG: DUF134 domain-containing protein [bacterium]
MPRPQCVRRIHGAPRVCYFKPRGVPLTALDEVVLTVDELEAVRLADRDGLYQEDAAAKMNISRATFGRVLESAHKKIAGALVEGKALRIEGGTVEMAVERKFKCAACGHQWQVAYGGGRPAACPQCQSANFHRAEADRGYARGGRRARGGGRHAQGGGGRWER